MAKKQFKAESKRLLDLMINSIYTNKEIFLREIISNASDAIDKLCYISLTDDKVGLDRADYRIRITVDKGARTITVSDNGIGMSQEEAEKNLGVIAKSGSFKFKNDMSAETRPLLSAVKNAEPKMLTPTKMNASEYSPRAATVISHRAGSYPTNTAASGCAKR